MPPYPYFRALYAVPVRQVRDLPTASFRFRLAADTLAVQLCASSLPTRTRDFHPLENAHAGQTKIIAAHELGHIFIHPKVNLNMLDNSLISDIEEYEANIFAMEFMPHIQPKSRNYLDFSAKELQNYICSKLLLQ